VITAASPRPERFGSRFLTDSRRRILLFQSTLQNKMSQELIDRLSNEEKVGGTACPVLGSLSPVTHREGTHKTELRVQGRCTPRCIRRDCKEEKRKFEPRGILLIRQAPANGSTISRFVPNICYKHTVHERWYRQFTGCIWVVRGHPCQLINFTTHRRLLDPLNIHWGPNIPLADEDNLLPGIDASKPNELSRLLPILGLIHIGPPFDLEPIRSAEVDIRPLFSLGKTLRFLEEDFDSRVLERRDRKAGPFHDLDRVIPGVTVRYGGGRRVSGGLVLFHK